MSHQLKVTLFVLAFNVIGFAEGYLLRDLGLLWVVPILIVTAFWSRPAEPAVVAAVKAAVAEKNPEGAPKGKWQCTQAWS
jgi:hypothetical protein